MGTALRSGLVSAPTNGEEEMRFLKHRVCYRRARVAAKRPEGSTAACPGLYSGERQKGPGLGRV